MRKGQRRWRTFFHAGCYEGPAQAETPNLRRYAGLASALRGGNTSGTPEKDEPRRGWAAGLTEQGRRGCNGVYGAGDKVDFRS